MLGQAEPGFGPGAGARTATAFAVTLASLARSAATVVGGGGAGLAVEGFAIEAEGFDSLGPGAAAADEEANAVEGLL